MTPPRGRSRRLIQHAIALDAVIVATGVALLVPSSTLAILASFLIAITAVAWAGPEELGLLATGYSVVVLGLFFGEAVDVPVLTMLACAGAIVSTLFRALRSVRGAAPADVAGIPLALPFALALPLLIVVVYTDVSDAIMRLYHVPSLLQPIIALVTIFVLAHREHFRPAEVAFDPAQLLFAAYAFVVFATSIWAKDGAKADERLVEVLKSLVICVLVASLAASWTRLRLALASVVAAASALSAVSVIQMFTGKLTNFFGGLVTVETANLYGDVAMARAAGPPVNEPNFYARILLLALPLAVALAVNATRQRVRVVCLGAAATVAAAVVLTYSRGALLTLALIGVLLLAAARVRLRSIAAAAVAAVILVSLLPAEIAAKRLLTLTELLPGWSSGGRTDTSIEVRKLYGRTALMMMAAHPLAGVGAGQYGAHYFAYSNIAGSSAYNYDPPGVEKFPHSLWLQIGAETGLAGLLTFFGAVAAALMMLWKTRRELLARGEGGHAFMATALAISIAGYLAASLFLHESYFRYLALFFGLASGIARLARNDGRIPLAHAKISGSRMRSATT